MGWRELIEYNWHVLGPPPIFNYLLVVMTLQNVVNLLIREEFWQVTTVRFKLVLVRVCVENGFFPRGDEFMSNKQHLV